MEAVHGFKFLWNKILKEYKVYYFLYGFVSIIMKALIVATLLRVEGSALTVRQLWEVQRHAYNKKLDFVPA